jgi:hypothetical protein
MSLRFGGVVAVFLFFFVSGVAFLLGLGLVVLTIHHHWFQDRRNKKS